MTDRWFSIALLGGAILGTTPAFGQSAAKDEKAWTMPRTPDGHPDLQGIWTNKTITPLERPVALGDKAFFTPEEAKAYTTSTLDRNDKDKRGGGVRDVLNAYNAFWWDSGTKVLRNMRTSIITDPPNGRIPPLTAHRQAQLQEAAEAVKVRCQRPARSCRQGRRSGFDDALHLVWNRRADAS